MNQFAIIFLLLNIIALLLLPRRWAPLPLLVGACYIIRDQMIEISSLSFTVLRILILVGLIRVFIRGERLQFHINGMDKLMVAWAFWAIISSMFHVDPSSSIINRLGIVYDALGMYYLLRVFFIGVDNIKFLCIFIAILLVPVAIEMIYESLKVKNLFDYFGDAALQVPAIREGRVRARGPFAHPILAGTVGAVCLPLMIGIWQQYRKTAIVGIVSCAIIIYCSASSGPILSAIAGIGALFAWRYQPKMRTILLITVSGYICVDLITSDPAYYYIMSRMNVTGGSTGWHRAQLMRSAIEHLSEWWLIGTDYTRNWMPTGVSWSKDQTDITNHYIRLGIFGGLPLMFMFIAIIFKGFSFVGLSLQRISDLPRKSRFLLWSFGSSLFAHTVTMMSVSYFDQSIIFIYLTFAAISSSYTCESAL